jgi:glyoxylase-like metal-dependent hydrolase (beta-lactamase superfamily II)
MPGTPSRGVERRAALIVRAVPIVVAMTMAAGAVGAQTAVPTADIRVRGLPASAFPRVSKLAENVYAYEQIDPTKRTITANNLIVVTSDGVLVADGQGTVDNVKRLVADIARITPQPIKYVVIGSEHGDHTGGDSAFPAGVTFIAHPFSKGNLERQARNPNRRTPTVVPTETVDASRTITMGSTEIRVLFLGRAHTGGDLEVYLPRERILYMSEVFSNRVFPSMANGYPSEWVETLKKAEQLDPAVFVPAHGFVDSPAVLKQEELNYRRALEWIVAEGRRLHEARVAIDNAPSSANFGPYDDWTRAANNGYAALKRVYLELEGGLTQDGQAPR